jgi:tripartite-type tricarboxylate transporter receptor subunit TctC
MKKTACFTLSAVACLWLLFAPQAKTVWGADEKYPSRSIECVCAYVPGGYADLINRFLVKSLEKHLKVVVVPGNKPGAGEVIAATAMANAPPDGYTMGLLADGPLVYSPILGRANEYKDKIAIIAQLICTTQVVAVAAESPWKTFREFADYARQNPGVVYAYGGVGTATHLRAEYINHIGNLKMRGLPLKGDPEVVTSVLGKHSAAGIFSYQAAKAQADTGKIRIIFSFTPPGTGPEPLLPTITTFFGKDVPDILPPSIYFTAPGKTPEPILKILESTIEKISRDPEFLHNTGTLYAQVCFQDAKTAKSTLERKVGEIRPIMQRAGLIQ